MFQVDACNREAHHGTEVEFKLAEVGGMAQSDHASVVRTGRKFAEDDFPLLGEEELHAPDTGTSECLSHLVGDMLRLLQRLFGDAVWLPTLAVVAPLLHMTDGRTEERGPLFLCHGEQGKFGIKVDKLLNNHLFHITTTALHSLGECLLQLIVVMNITLSVSGGRHQRFYHTGEANLIGSLLELVKGLGIEIFGSSQSQFLGSQIADSPSVHGIVDGPSTGHHLNALLFEIKQPFGAYRLYLWHNDVGLVFLHHSLQRIAV